MIEAVSREDLVKLIEDHLAVTGEGAYAFGARVMKDKAFIYKLTHYGRTPYRRTITKIKRAISLREKIIRGMKGKGRNGAKRKSRRHGAARRGRR